jgi:hypothetical protein
MKFSSSSSFYYCSCVLWRIQHYDVFHIYVGFSPKIRNIDCDGIRTSYLNNYSEKEFPQQTGGPTEHQRCSSVSVLEHEQSPQNVGICHQSVSERQSHLCIHVCWRTEWILWPQIAQGDNCEANEELLLRTSRVNTTWQRVFHWVLLGVNSSLY